MPKSSTKFMVHQTHTQQELLSKTIVIQIEKKKKKKAYKYSLQNPN